MSQEVKRMDPEIKARWVSDLRAGRFAQGYGQLVSFLNSDDPQPRGACCLGFLCEIARDDGVVEYYFGSDGEAIYRSADQEEWHPLAESGAYIPAPVGKWAGVDSIDPVVVVIPANLPHVDWAEVFSSDESVDTSLDGWMNIPVHVALSDLNDKGATLDEIANLIEEQL